MNILDIAIAKQLAGGGGGSGTDNYNDLSNLPKINDTTLSGNKTSANLGLQSEINSDSKLASDLVDDTNQDNKFVTTTEKNTWNSKQNAIDADHKLSSSLVSFTEAEAAALASGIDSTKVGQISTNQTNILYVLNRTGKNCMDLQNAYGSRSQSGIQTVTNGQNGEVSISITNATWTTYQVVGYVKPNTSYTLVTYVSNYVSAINGFVKASLTSEDNLTNFGILDNGTLVHPFTTGSSDQIRICYNLNNSATAKSNSVTLRAMLVETTTYNIDSTYVPASLPNYDLTRLEAEDRAGLVDVVDSGAKNLINCSVDNIKSLNSSSSYSWNGNTVTAYGRTATVNSDGTITVAAGTGSEEFWLKVANYTYASGISYVLSGCPANGSTTTYYMESDNLNLRDIGSGVVINSTTTDALYVVVKTTGSTSALTFKPMLCTKAAFGVSQKFVPFGNDPFYQVPINHNMIYRGRNLGATFTDAQHTALSSGNFNDLYLGDYWTKTVTIPAGTYTGGDGEAVTVPAQTNITLKAVIADFDTFYAGYASSNAGINTHHAAVIVTGFSNVVWNKTNSTAGGYVASLIHKWLVGSALPQIETWFGSAKVLSHQKLLTNAITGDAASGWAWSSQKISLLSENQVYGSKVWGNSKAANGGYEPGEAFKHLNVFNHIDANLLFGNKNIWLRDIASAEWAAFLDDSGHASDYVASYAWIAPAALILLS